MIRMIGVSPRMGSAGQLCGDFEKCSIRIIAARCQVHAGFRFLEISYVPVLASEPRAAPTNFLSFLAQQRNCQGYLAEPLRCFRHYGRGPRWGVCGGLCDRCRNTSGNSSNYVQYDRYSRAQGSGNWWTEGICFVLLTYNGAASFP